MCDLLNSIRHWHTPPSPSLIEINASCCPLHLKLFSAHIWFGEEEKKNNINRFNLLCYFALHKALMRTNVDGKAIIFAKMLCTWMGKTSWLPSFLPKTVTKPDNYAMLCHNDMKHIHRTSSDVGWSNGNRYSCISVFLFSLPKYGVNNAAREVERMKIENRCFKKRESRKKTQHIMLIAYQHRQHHHGWQRHINSGEIFAQ